LHHDIPGRVKAVDNTFSHDRGQQFGRLHPGQTAVTGRGESERCDEVVAPGRNWLFGSFGPPSTISQLANETRTDPLAHQLNA
jgi:hypothetical protein